MSLTVSTYYDFMVGVFGPLAGIAVAVIGALYMVGHLIGKEEYKKAAKLSLLHLFIITLLLSFFLQPISYFVSAIVREIDPVGAYFYCQQQPSPLSYDFCFVDVSRGYTKALLAENIGMLRNVLKVYSITKAVEGVVLTSHNGFLALNRPISLEGATAPYNLILENYLNYMKPLMLTSTFQMFLVDIFTDPRVFATLLFLGSSLRVLPFTKKLGGLLSAISLVLFFFLPTMISVVDATYFNIPPSLHTKMRLNRIYTGDLFLKYDYKVTTYGGKVFAGKTLIEFDSQYRQGQSVPLPDRDNPENNIPPPKPEEILEYASPTISPTEGISQISEDQLREVEQLSAEEVLEIENEESLSIMETLKGFIRWMRQISLILAPIFPAMSTTAITASIELAASISAGSIGAGAGAAIGSLFIPGLGTAIGGFIGYLAGAWIGGMVGGIVGKIVAIGIASTGLLFISPLTGIDLVYMQTLQIADGLANIFIFNVMFAYAFLVATIGAIKSLSQFLYGDVEIAGLSQFI